MYSICGAGAAAPSAGTYNVVNVISKESKT